MNEEKWKSSLGPKEQRFLSQALSYARDATVGTISNERLLEAFGPDDIMQGFRDVPQRRADILGACVGTKRNTAVKKSPEEAARDLVLALDSGDTNADDICALIPSDDFVRYHIPARIWALLFHDRWPDRRTPEHARLMVYLVEQVLALSLLGANTSREVVQAIGVEEFDRVPSSLRIRVLRLALDMGEGQTASAKPEPFRAQQLLGVLPPSELVEHLELPVLERVLAVVARRYRWVEDTASATTGGSSPPGERVSMPPPLPPTPGSLRNTYPRSDVDDLDVNNDLAEPIELAPKYPSQHPASAEMSEPAPVAPAPADAAATSPALPPLPGAAKGDATSTNSGTGQSLMPPALPSQRPGALFGARPGPPPFHRNGGDGST